MYADCLQQQRLYYHQMHCKLSGESHMMLMQSTLPELWFGVRCACLHVGCSQQHLSRISCCVGCQVVPDIFLVQGEAEVKDKRHRSTDGAVKSDGKLSIGGQEGVRVKVACMSKAMQ